MASSVKRSAEICVVLRVIRVVHAFSLRSEIDRFGYIRIENIISVFDEIAFAELQYVENIVFRKFRVVCEHVFENKSADVCKNSHRLGVFARDFNPFYIVKLGFQFFSALRSGKNFRVLRSENRGNVNGFGRAEIELRLVSFRRAINLDGDFRFVNLSVRMNVLSGKNRVSYAVCGYANFAVRQFFDIEKIFVFRREFARIRRSVNGYEG